MPTPPPSKQQLPGRARADAGPTGRRRPAASRFRRFIERPPVFALLLITPALIFFFVWNIVPVLTLIGVSFYNYSMVTGMPPRYIGLGNYEDIVYSFRLWESFGRTLRWVLVTVGIETVLGIAIGILFWGSVRLPGRRLALTLLFTPMLLTPLAAGIFFRLMYEPSIGIINYVTRWIGMGTISFLSDRNLAFAAVVFVDVWMWTPFMVLITLAALGSVPKAELEAAEVDRLPWWRRLVTVVLPHAKFILMIGILLRTIESFKTMDLVFNMTGGGPGTTTELVALTLWRRAFEAFNLGWSSALAFILLLMAIAFTSIFLFVLNLRKRQQEREANA